MKIDLSQLEIKPTGIVIVTAPEDRWGEIGAVLSKSDIRLPEELKGTPILFLEPGEKIASLSAEELAMAGLKRI